MKKALLLLTLISTTSFASTMQKINCSDITEIEPLNADGTSQGAFTFSIFSVGTREIEENSNGRTVHDIYESTNMSTQQGALPVSKKNIELFKKYNEQKQTDGTIKETISTVQFYKSASKADWQRFSSTTVNVFKLNQDGSKDLLSSSTNGVPDPMDGVTDHISYLSDGTVVEEGNSTKPYVQTDKPDGSDITFTTKILSDNFSCVYTPVAN